MAAAFSPSLLADPWVAAHFIEDAGDHTSFVRLGVSSLLSWRWHPKLHALTQPPLSPTSLADFGIFAISRSADLGQNDYPKDVAGALFLLLPVSVGNL
jgi:hypothetical protein